MVLIQSPKIFSNCKSACAFILFYKKLDIQAILFDFFYFPINAPALTKQRRPRGLRAPDAEVIGGARPEGALRSGTEKRPGMGRPADKRKEADAAEGQEERSNEAAAGTPESTTAGFLWNPAVPPEWRKI